MLYIQNPSENISFISGKKGTPTSYHKAKVLTQSMTSQSRFSKSRLEELWQKQEPLEPLGAFSTWGWRSPLEVK